jgi:hypothetical protein
MMKQYFLLLFFLTSFCFIDAQTIQQLTSNNKISLRGLSVVNDNVIWASGSSGQVAKSIDGGKDFEWITVKGYEKRDFRDIEAFDANTAVIMAVDVPSIILKTKDGGKTWKEVFHDERKGMFLDAMDFTSDGNGMVLGDPINSKLFIATTNDSGNTWIAKKEESNLYKVDTGEALFAASGTNVKITSNTKRDDYVFVTGGTQSRLYIYNSFIPLNDIVQGKETTGANSITINSKYNKLVIVGGDFANDSSDYKNCEFFTLSKNKIEEHLCDTPPHGYRSCVAFITDDSLVCCGTTGVDISNDGGLNWKLISNESFNVCAKAKKENAVFLAGKDGRIAKLAN